MNWYLEKGASGESATRFFIPVSRCPARVEDPYGCPGVVERLFICERPVPPAKLVQQTCTCRKKPRFRPKKSHSGYFFALIRPNTMVYWIPGTGFRSCSWHKHGGRKFINEGASSVGGSRMPLYMTIVRAVDMGLTGGTASASSWMCESR